MLSSCIHGPKFYTIKYEIQRGDGFKPACNGKYNIEFLIKTRTSYENQWVTCDLKGHPLAENETVGMLFYPLIGTAFLTYDFKILLTKDWCLIS